MYENKKKIIIYHNNYCIVSRRRNGMERHKSHIQYAHGIYRSIPVSVVSPGIALAISAMAFPSCCIPNSDTVGADVGINVGADVGTNVGDDVGTNVGADIGANVGADIGINVGADIGTNVGADVGADIVFRIETII